MKTHLLKSTFWGLVFATCVFVVAGCRSEPAELDPGSVAVGAAATWLAVGTFWFWFIIVAEIFCLFIAVANDSDVGGWISIGIFGGLLYFFSDVSFSYVIEHPWMILGLIILYFGLGLAVALWKWYVKASDHAEDAKEFKEDWYVKRRSWVKEEAETDGRELDKDAYAEPLSQEDWCKREGFNYPLNEDIDAEAFAKWTVYDEDRQRETKEFHKSRRESGYVKLLIRNNKREFFRWASFWPLVLLWSLFDDVLRKAYNKVYKLIAGRLQEMSDKIWAAAGFDPEDEEDKDHTARRYRRY